MASNDTQSRLRQNRRQHPQAACIIPRPDLDLDIPVYKISDTQGNPLGREYNLLAHAMLELDVKFLRKAMSTKAAPSVDENSLEAIAAQKIKDVLNDVSAQQKAIKISEAGYAKSYLTDISFIRVWHDALNKMRKSLATCKRDAAGQNTKDQIGKNLLDYVALATRLKAALIDAASEGILDDDIKESVGARWQRLDEFLTWYRNSHTKHGKHDPIQITNLPPWQSVSIEIRKAQEKKPPPVPNQPLPGTVHSPGPLSIAIALLGSLLSMLFFAQGYAKSPHVKGSRNVPDFWFILNSTVAQTTSLLSATLLAWNIRKVLAWHWLVPLGLAGVLTLITPCLYILAPTEWASCTPTIATMIQSYSVLQQYYVMASATLQVRHGKSE